MQIKLEFSCSYRPISLHIINTLSYFFTSPSSLTITPQERNFQPRFCSIFSTLLRTATLLPPTEVNFQNRNCQEER